MQDLKSDIDYLKSIDVGFDRQAALSSVEQIRNLLQDKLKDNPIVIPVKAGVPSLDDAQRNAAGGHITGPGTGTSDSILSWLSNGEYVVKAAAVKRYGISMLDRINSMSIPRFASGGYVNQSMPQAAGTPINLNFPGGQSFPVTASADIASEIEKFFRREALRAGSKR